MKKVIAFLIIFISISNISIAHSGRTDSNGGHYDSSTGEYHYHNDGSSYENELIVEDDDNTISSFDKYQIEKLNNTIKSKQEKIDELNAEIEEFNQRIKYSKFREAIYLSAIMGLSIYIIVKKHFKCKAKKK